MVLLVGVVVLVLVLGGKKKKPPTNYVSEELTADSNVSKGDVEPKKPERPPPPKIRDEIIQAAKALVADAKLEQEAGDAHYEEAMDARRAGDEETWQSKLTEARDHYINIREMWNEQIEAPIDDELPTGSEWEADEVANYWLGKEAEKINKMLKNIGAINKQLRMK